MVQLMCPKLCNKNELQCNGDLTLSWTEIAFHESLRDQSEMKTLRFVNLIKNLDCCLTELDDNFEHLPKHTRSRLAQDLLALCLQQVHYVRFITVIKKELEAENEQVKIFS